MKNNWTYLDEWIIIQALKVSKEILESSSPGTKKNVIIPPVFREVFAFHLYCTINSFRNRLNLSDEHTRELHQALFIGVNAIDWKDVPARTYADVKNLKKQAAEIKLIAQDKIINDLVYGYLCGNKSIAGVDDNLLSIIGGIVGVKDLSDSFIANYVVSFTRILCAIDLINTGKLVTSEFFNIYQIWMLHTGSANNLINHVGTIIKETHGA